MTVRKILGRIGAPYVLVGLLVGTAAAAVTLVYMNSAQLSLGTKAAPVVYEPGADGGVSDYVPAFTLSPNKTSFTVALRGVPEATVTIDDLFRIRNQDTRPHSVILSSDPVTNALVLVYKVEFFDGATRVGTLDFKSASPSVTFPALAAGKVLTAKTTLLLSAGAGGDSVADVRNLVLDVSS